MTSVLQQKLLIVKIAIAHALQNPDSDRYGPLSSTENCKINYFENTEHGGERFCTECPHGFENFYPEHQNYCTLYAQHRNNGHALPEFKINVEPCTESDIKFIKKHHDNIYPMKHRRGLVVIFNNNFEGKFLRKGAKKDVSDLKQLWTEFGCKIIIKEDKNASEMIKILQDVAKGDKEITDGEKFNYLAVFVMSHGEEEIVYGNDHAHVSVKDIKCYFSNANSRYWIGIPKLFFFQFCRGTKCDLGLELDESDSIISEYSGQATHCSYSDIFISYATLSEFAALRHSQSGSWFINSIRDVFMKYARIEHVAELMTRVRRAVSSKTGRVKNKDGTITECKAIGESHDMLIRKLYLQPGRQ